MAESVGKGAFKRFLQKFERAAYIFRPEVHPRFFKIEQVGIFVLQARGASEMLRNRRTSGGGGVLFYRPEVHPVYCETEGFGRQVNVFLFYSPNRI